MIGFALKLMFVQKACWNKLNAVLKLCTCGVKTVHLGKISSVCFYRPWNTMTLKIY